MYTEIDLKIKFLFQNDEGENIYGLNLLYLYNTITKYIN